MDSFQPTISASGSSTEQVGYFPGCSLESSAQEYNQSNFMVCRELGIQLKELPEWSCCGSHAAHHTHHLLSTALGVRNLSIASGSGMNKLVAPCPACHNRLKSAQTELAANRQLKKRFKAELDLSCNDKMEVLSLLQLLDLYQLVHP